MPQNLFRVKINTETMTYYISDRACCKRGWPNEHLLKMDAVMLMKGLWYWKDWMVTSKEVFIYFVAFVLVLFHVQCWLYILQKEEKYAPFTCFVLYKVKKEIKAMLDHVFHWNVGRCIRFIVFTVFIMRHRYCDISLTSGTIGLDDKTKTSSTEPSLAQHFYFDGELHKCNQDIQNVHEISPINIQRGIFRE
jgi:hypothetical protein